MKRFKRILVVYDDAVGGDDALSQAVALSLNNDAHLTIAAALHQGQSDSFAGETGKRMERLVSGVRYAGVREVSGKILRGVPHLEIIRQVMAANHDLVIISAEAGKTLRDVFFGGVATHLMRKCPCPVWVIRPGQAVPYRKILAAVDPSPAMPRNDLNIKIMDLAVSLASRDHATLHVVHAWDVVGKDRETIKSETTAQEYEAILRRHEEERRTLVEELLAGYPIKEISYKMHLARELPERAIIGLTEREQIDLVVMGTVGRYGIRGFALGNAVEAVMHSVKCGMLAVKPDQFVTPIERPELVLARNRTLETPGEAGRRTA